MNVRDWVQHLLSEHHKHSHRSMGEGFAPVNIALIKYWGKREKTFNLPITDSLSIGLRTLGTRTRIGFAKAGKDEFVLNEQVLGEESKAYQRLVSFLDLFRESDQVFYRIDSENDVPTGAGLASSASGFAALVLALNDLHAWQLSDRQLSLLARIGSGSACRSLWDGFVHWQAGVDAQGEDSYAQPWRNCVMPQLRVALLPISEQPKTISSRTGMEQTVHGLSLYSAWPNLVKQHFKRIEFAIRDNDLESMAQIAEHNAMAMHASMISAYPSLCYWLPETLAGLHQLWKARDEGLSCWATLDAGPNIKLRFDDANEADVRSLFSNMQVVQPFADSSEVT